TMMGTSTTAGTIQYAMTGDSLQPGRLLPLSCCSSLAIAIPTRRNAVTVSMTRKAAKYRNGYWASSGVRHQDRLGQQHCRGRSALLLRGRNSFVRCCPGLHLHVEVPQPWLLDWHLTLRLSVQLSYPHHSSQT